jgi:hypothetical protein
MIPIIGFAPDSDPVTPGVLTDCSNVVPFDAGMMGAPVAADLGLTALAAECRGAALLTDLAGTRKLWAGTSAAAASPALYQQSGSGWTDRSRGAGYTLGADDRWSFAQFGNDALAASPSCKVQRSTGAAFADVASAPQAKIIVVAKDFAVALNTSVTTDTWYCSAYLDASDWTLSVSNQCVTGRLVSTPGALTAGLRFGDDVIAYKERSVYVGRYVGAPDVWRWDVVSNDVGCVGQEAVADTSYGHIFVGIDGVYLYNGTATIQPLSNGVLARWMRTDMSATYRYRTKVLWDKTNGLVWIYYPSAASSGACDRCVVYHPLTKRWGVAHATVEAVANYASAAITFDGGSTFLGTYDGGPTIPYDSPIWFGGEVGAAVFNTSHKVCTLSGGSVSSYFVTGDLGEDRGDTHCDMLAMRYSQLPTTSSATGYTRDEGGGSLVTQETSTQADGKHDMRQTARWHRFRVDQTGPWKAIGYQPRFRSAGNR